jgi:hypothetical protein
LARLRELRDGLSLAVQVVAMTVSEFGGVREAPQSPPVPVAPLVSPFVAIRWNETLPERPDIKSAVVLLVAIIRLCHRSSAQYERDGQRQRVPFANIVISFGPSVPSKRTARPSFPADKDKYVGEALPVRLAQTEVGNPRRGGLSRRERKRRLRSCSWLAGFAAGANFFKYVGNPT